MSQNKTLLIYETPALLTPVQKQTIQRQVQVLADGVGAVGVVVDGGATAHREADPQATLDAVNALALQVGTLAAAVETMTAGYSRILDYVINAEGGGELLDDDAAPMPMSNAR
jgi:hypothetical protein